MDNSHVNLAIVGGGPVGLSLATAVQGYGLKVALLEARESTHTGIEERSLAISYGSKLFFERNSAWPCGDDVTPIKAIHVSQRGGFGSTTLHAEQANVPELGYVMRYSLLVNKLNSCVSGSNVNVTYGAKVAKVGQTSQYAAIEFDVKMARKSLTADLVAVADGGFLQGVVTAGLRVKKYDQHALLAYVETQLPHKNIAYERFTPSGPIALLPNGKGFSLVWVAKPDDTQRRLQLADTDFLFELHQCFGDRCGDFVSVTQKKVVPLALRYARKIANTRTVVLGNAAQLLHPVAGQGLNLGIRDAANLAHEILRDLPGIGSAEMLRDYQKRRVIDRTGNIFFTDLLAQLYSNNISLLRVVRGMGLASLNFLPFAKRNLMRRMMFGVTQN